jgi:(4S)-4-hydroxy-5-phosphonooxypentane-2,3-dione isomerase
MGARCRGEAETHIKNAAVQHFGEVMDELVEGWTMVIPFADSTASNTDE